MSCHKVMVDGWQASGKGCESEDSNDLSFQRAAVPKELMGGSHRQSRQENT